MTVSQALAVLGLQGHVTKGEARSAYLHLVKVWHPDRFAADPRLQAKAHAQLKAINAAYEFLCAVWESERIVLAPDSPPLAPDPSGPRNAGNSRAQSTSGEHSRPARRWVSWALVIGLAWVGAFILSTANESGPAGSGTSNAGLASEPAVSSGSVPARSVDAHPDPQAGDALPTTDMQAASTARRPPGKPASNESVAEAEAVLDSDMLKQVAEILRPENGEELVLALPDPGGEDIGRGIFNVDNGTKWDGVMVLSRLGVARRAFYIRAKSRAALTNVGAHSYEATFMLGTTWSTEEGSFEANQQFLGFEKPLDFIEEADVDKITTSEISVTLHTVKGGKARSSRIRPFRLPLRVE